VYVRDPNIVRADPDAADAGLVAWCHGAPGIGLARAASVDTLGDRHFEEELTTSVETTLRHGVGHNHCLCHGDLGNLDVVLQITDKCDRDDWRSAALAGLGSAVASGRSTGWLCGMPEGIDPPGLMTGIAGIGYSLLRLANPSGTPSVLSFGHRI